MVRHGTAKKRRRNSKVSRSGPKNAKLKVANAVPQRIRDEWDKTISPALNMAKFGLEADPNQTLNNMSGIGRKHVKPKGADNASAAFIGMMVVPPDDFKEKNVKLKTLAEVDQQMAAALIKAHGSDYAKMAKDTKVNYNQLTETKCRNLCRKFEDLEESERLV